MKDLVEVIKANPGCIAEIDNDCWTLWRAEIDNPPHPGAWDDDSWVNDMRLAHSDEKLKPLGSGYGSGNCYGGDILQALAIIVGITVRSV